MRYALAIDIGASSGRHILGHLQDGKIVLEEVNRFENNMVERNGHLCWDIDALMSEVNTGIAKCGQPPHSIGMLDVLTGAVTPSGKLAETWPLRYEDTPCSGYYGAPHRDAEYREGIYVGYRYYETAGVPVRFPFGYGLSYTNFAYSNLLIDGNIVTATVTNTGDIAGAEIAQLYVAPPKGGMHRPAKELKGFAKVFLQPGQSQNVTFTLNERSFALWSDGWIVQKGVYEIQIAAAVCDVRLSARIEADGADITVPVWQEGSWYAAPKGLPSKADFEAMLGTVIREPRPPCKGDFTEENTILEMAEHSVFSRIVKYFMEKTLAKTYGGKVDYNNPTFRMAVSSSVDCALFGLVNCSGGAMPENVALGLLDAANGHRLRGIRRMIKNS